MRNKMILRQFLFISLAFSLYANDEKKSMPVWKKYATNNKRLWTEKDVKDFLKLPFSQAPTDISRVNLNIFYGMRRIDDFANISDKVNKLEPNDNSLGGVSFKLCSSKLNAFDVSIYNPTSCKAACNSILKYVTSTIPFWSNIPTIYEPHIKNGIYTLLTKWLPYEELYFDTKRLFIIQVRYATFQVNKTPNPKIIAAETDKIIESLIKFINDNQARGKKGKGISGEEDKSPYRLDYTFYGFHLGCTQREAFAVLDKSKNVTYCTQWENFGCERFLFADDNETDKIDFYVLTFWIKRLISVQLISKERKLLSVNELFSTLKKDLEEKYGKMEYDELDKKYYVIYKKKMEVELFLPQANKPNVFIAATNLPLLGLKSEYDIQQELHEVGD